MIQTLTKPTQTTTPSNAAPATISVASSIALFPSSAHQQATIQWLESGKPTLDGDQLQGVETSLSHDDHACLCVVGEGPQGCDIAPITERTRSNWLILLTPDKSDLLQEVISSGDSLDIAGSRIWAATEAVIKAGGPEAKRSLTLEQRDGDSVLFSANAGSQMLHVLTFPLELNHAPKRIVAVVVIKQG